MYGCQHKIKYPNCNIPYKNKNHKNLHNLIYLGFIITWYGDCIQEIKRTIAIAKDSFKRLKSMNQYKDIYRQLCYCSLRLFDVLYITIHCSSPCHSRSSFFCHLGFSGVCFKTRISFYHQHTSNTAPTLLCL